MFLSIVASISCRPSLPVIGSFSKSEMAVLRQFRAKASQPRLQEAEHILDLLSKRGLTNFSRFDILMILGSPSHQTEQVLDYDLNESASQMFAANRYNLLIFVSNRVEQIVISVRPIDTREVKPALLF